MNDKVLTMRNGKTVWGPAPKDTGPIDPKRLPEGYAAKGEPNYKMLVDVVAPCAA